MGNQNVLRPSDIEKIVTAYRERKTEDRYSNLIEIKKIEENEFNLNISRYVDVFEKEEVIDIESVALKLQEIESEIMPINEEIRKFCVELGIKCPF